jgi:hypothetical protein
MSPGTISAMACFASMSSPGLAATFESRPAAGAVTVV